MRILISLATAVLAATSAVSSAPSAGDESAAHSCRPAAGTTVWAWPLNARTNPSTAARPPGAPPDEQAPPQGNPPADSDARPGSNAQPGSDAPPDSNAPAVLRGFEPPVHRWDAGHRGVDLAGTLGAAVVAAGDGTVLFAGRIADQGVVVVGHGVLRTSYEPVEPGVRVGTKVTTGQRIGTLDAGHCATACLHWGLLTGHGHGVVYYDPLLLLGCGQVRLEPLPAATPSASTLQRGTSTIIGTAQPQPDPPRHETAP